MKNEGLADADAANPFRFTQASPRNCSAVGLAPGRDAAGSSITWSARCRSDGGIVNWECYPSHLCKGTCGLYRRRT